MFSLSYKYIIDTAQLSYLRYNKSMVIVMAIMCVLLVILKAVLPHDSKYSEFELKRRGDQSETAKLDVLRHDLYHDIRMWLDTKEMVLMIALTLLLADVYGIGEGVAYALVAFLLYRNLARIPFLQRQVQKLYDANEVKVLDGVKRIRPVTRLLYGQPVEIEKEIASREELEYMIEQSNRFLDDTERSMVASGLTFANKQVSEYMIERDNIDSVTDNELLGPLVLDDLHRTGHSRFPVVRESLDDIVGILSVDDFLSIDDRQSLNVKSAMSESVSYIHQDQTLRMAFAALVETSQQLLIVINDNQETVGLLSLSDITRQIFGRELVGEFDEHSNRAAVAARQAR